MSSMDDEIANTVKVYPTLAEETISISGLTTSEQVQIISINGNVIMEAKVDANDNTLNVDGLSQGKYLVRIGNSTYPFIKK